ncbi:MAG: 3-phosphoshikimate 1-carboxyvinyltransferase [Candidatus Methanomethyliaceae archaeon]
MDSIVIRGGKIEGELIAPPSKSMTIRAITASVLASGTSVIINPSVSEDGLASISVGDSLGANLRTESDRVVVEGTKGLSGRLKTNTIDCRESGLCARMFIPICALRDEEITVRGSGSLMRRPIGNLNELRQFNISCKSRGGYLPVQVKGRLKGCDATVDGRLTSQIISGLLFCLPFAEEDSTLRIKDAKSKPYIRMTVEILKMANIQLDTDLDLTNIYVKGGQALTPIEYTVEGDWSSASFFLVAGAFSGSITIKNLRLDSNQADKKVLEALHLCGAKVRLSQEGVHVEESELHSFEFDVSDCPDLFPPLCILAACARGKSTIYGIERQPFKESNRLQSMCEGLSRLGVKFDLSEGKIRIKGLETIKGGTVDPKGDHRIAMSFAILGLRCKEGIEILNPGCVKKSYPQFFDDLTRIAK